MNKKEGKTLLNFFSEVGLLKRVRRSGWWVLGVKDSETVAEHSFRCVVIGYIIAKMEGVFPYKVLVMTVFNDMHEARINDLHKMAQRYFNFEKAQVKAFNEQVDPLPKDIKDELKMLHKEYRAQKTKESIIARDADILECLLQAKEYYEHGFSKAVKFMKKAPHFLRTKSAKRLWDLTKAMDLDEWWERLSEFRR